MIVFVLKPCFVFSSVGEPFQLVHFKAGSHSDEGFVSEPKAASFCLCGWKEDLGVETVRNWCFLISSDRTGLKGVPLLWLALRSKNADRVRHKGSTDEMIDYPPSFVSSSTLSLFVWVCLSSLTKQKMLRLPQATRGPLSACSYLFRQAPNPPPPTTFVSNCSPLCCFFQHLTVLCSIMLRANIS